MVIDTKVSLRTKGSKFVQFGKLKLKKSKVNFYLESVSYHSLFHARFLSGKVEDIHLF